MELGAGLTALALTLITVGVTSVLALPSLTHSLKASDAEDPCPTKIARTDDASLRAITQGKMIAQRSFPLFEFNGVSEIAQIAGTLHKGDTFCFTESDLDWGFTIFDGSRDIEVSLIRTADHPEGVYSEVASAIPVLPSQGDERASSRAIPLAVKHWWPNRPADAPAPHRSMVAEIAVGAAGESAVVEGVSAAEVRSLG